MIAPEASPSPPYRQVHLQPLGAVQAWCHYFACSEWDLRQAVHVVGDCPEDVRNFLTAHQGIAWERLIA